MGLTQFIQQSVISNHKSTIMSCCPPNADKYLAATYNTTGKKVTLPSGLEVYRSGSANENKKAVLIISDVWGWNSGRTRNIADLFAEAGYLAIVPKLLTPAFEGGTDGEGCSTIILVRIILNSSCFCLTSGLYPTFDFVKDGHTAFPYFATFDYEGNGFAFKVHVYTAYFTTLKLFYCLTTSRQPPSQNHRRRGVSEERGSHPDRRLRILLVSN